MKILRKIDNRVVLACIIVIQIFFMLYYCNMKQGFFVDEIWSYGLSNSYYHAQIWEDGAMDQTEMSPEEFKDYLIVNDGEQFSYGSVIYNQEHDVHPPLFYIVLHTVSSFFPETFSKWFGLVPNILYYLVCILFIYKISSLFTKSRYLPFAPVLLYGFSIAAVNTVTYIRMYMLLTMCALMFAYVHIKWFKEKHIKISDVLLLAMSTFLGMLSHFFFLIFAFPWVVILAIKIWMNKDWKKFRIYAVSGIVPAILACVVYPEYIKKLLGNSNGKTQSLNSGSESLLSRSTTLINITDSEIFGNALRIIILILIIAIVICVILKYICKITVIKDDGYLLSIERRMIPKKINWKIKEEYIIYSYMLVCVLIYYIIAAKIIPWLTDRFIMVQFPLVTILFSCLLYWVICCWRIKQQNRFGLILCVIILVGGLTYFSSDPQYLYENKKDNIMISKQYRSLPCVFVYADSNAYVMINNALELQNYNNVYQIYHGNIDSCLMDVEVDTDGVVLYLDKALVWKNNLTIQQFVDTVMIDKKLSIQENLFEDDMVYVYYLHN